MNKTIDFKVKKGSVENCEYFTGKSAVYGNPLGGNNIVLIAPNNKILKRQWKTLFEIDINPAGIEDVAIFQLKNVKLAKRKAK